jgi:hypothetical protein
MVDDFFELTGTHLSIERVHASGMDADQHFAFPYSWAFRFFVPQNFRSAISVHSNCVHKL